MSPCVCGATYAVLVVTMPLKLGKDFAKAVRLNAVETFALAASISGKSKETHATQLMIRVVSAHTCYDSTIQLDQITLDDFNAFGPAGR